MRKVIPSDSRYIPLTQQKSCCVPTCMQMVMHKNNIPLIPSEQIGYQLGLVVHPDNKTFFYNVRTSKTPPPSGYGTRMYEPEYEPTKALKRLKIPLEINFTPANKFKTTKDLKDYLSNIEKQDKDVLLCVNSGVLNDNPEKSGGHVVVFDRMKNGSIRIINSSPNQPKWRKVSVVKMLNAMKKHKNKKSGGVWKIIKI